MSSSLSDSYYIPRGQLYRMADLPAPLSFTVAQRAEVEQLLNYPIATLVRNFITNEVQLPPNSSDLYALLLLVLRRCSSLLFFEFNPRNLQSLLWGQDEILDNLNVTPILTCPPIRVLRMTRTNFVAAVAALEHAPLVEILTVACDTDSEPRTPDTLPTLLPCTHLRYASFWNTPPALAQLVVQSCLASLRGLKLRTLDTPALAVLTQHTDANYITYFCVSARPLTAQSCFKSDRCAAHDSRLDFAIATVRACPRLQHLELLYFRADQMRTVLNAVHHPLRTFAATPHLGGYSAGDAAQIIRELVVAPHRTLVGVRILSIRSQRMDLSAIVQACTSRRIVLRRCGGLHSLAQGPSRFETLFGRGRYWDVS